MSTASSTLGSYTPSVAPSHSSYGHAKGSRPTNNAPYNSQWYPRFQRPSSHMTPSQRQQRGFEPRSHTSIAPQRPSSHRAPSSTSVTPRPSIAPSTPTATSSRPTTGSKSSYSSNQSASVRPTFTSFYSSSSESINSLASSPATSISSGPPLVPVVTEQMLQPHTEQPSLDTFKRQTSMSRRLSVKLKASPPEVKRTQSDYPSAPVVPNFSVPRQSFSSPRKSFGLGGKRASVGISSTPGPARYYQDPDARRKLQQCLSSPQKFDEALDFGFAPTPQPVTPTSPRVQPEFSGNHVHYFLKDSKFLDDSSQFGGDSQDDDESVVSSDGYEEKGSYGGIRRDVTHTGFDDQAYERRRSTGKSRSSRALRRKTLDGEMFGEREMTLRLTLTKPEMRDTGSGGTVDHAARETAGFELQQQQRMRDHVAMQRAVSRDGKKQNSLFSRFKAKR